MVIDAKIKPAEIFYPESDGLPMSDNSKQWDWIVYIKQGSENVLKEEPLVLVNGDLLWYPVEGNNKLCVAPDVMITFGRPRGYRGSYKQWLEGGIPPQVVFEVLSPSNNEREMEWKFGFYERFGVEEYYLFDPNNITLEGWRRSGRKLIEIKPMQGWVSPRLGIKFELDPTAKDAELKLYKPNGEPFATYAELDAQRLQAQFTAEQERQRAEQERRQKDLALQQIEQERQRAEQERQEKETAQQQVEQLMAQLRALGHEPEN